MLYIRNLLILEQERISILSWSMLLITLKWPCRRGIHRVMLIPPKLQSTLNPMRLQDLAIVTNTPLETDIVLLEKFKSHDRVQWDPKTDLYSYRVQVLRLPHSLVLKFFSLAWIQFSEQSCSVDRDTTPDSQGGWDTSPCFERIVEGSTPGYRGTGEGRWGSCNAHS